MTGIILVTGAAGKTGRSVIRALAQKGVSVRALVHREAQITEVRSAGAQEVLVGNFLSESTLEAAAAGVRAVYHICPNMHPDEVQIGQAILQAARAANIDHFVYHSVLHPQTEKMPHHWKKLKVEELLFETGLPFTILQPTAYMQNILASQLSIKTQGIYPNPYPIESELSLVDLQDVSEAAAIVLTEHGHLGATYELTGTAPLSQTLVATVLSQELGHPVVAQEIPLDDWQARAQIHDGLSAYAIETLVKMFRYYARYGLKGNPRVLETLLGRAPTSLAAFVRREIV